MRGRARLLLGGRRHADAPAKPPAADAGTSDRRGKRPSDRRSPGRDPGPQFSLETGSEPDFAPGPFLAEPEPVAAHRRGGNAPDGGRGNPGPGGGPPPAGPNRPP
ncbi:uncharacterized [Tachysurus ichikawai]